MMILWGQEKEEEEEEEQGMEGTGLGEMEEVEKEEVKSEGTRVVWETGTVQYRV
jgi:hypothetical protein